MESEQGPLYGAWLHLRVPQHLPDAVQRAARRRHQSKAEWVRQVLLRAIAAEAGVVAPLKSEQSWRG